MSTLVKALLFQLWFFFVLPAAGWVLFLVLGPAGLFVYLFLAAAWCWGIYAYNHYRFCRQEEFLHVLHTAAASGAPLEPVLKAYLEGRPAGLLYGFWSGLILFFVFPGYYWVHKGRSFDARVAELLKLLSRGVPLDDALARVPGLVSRETALAVTVGQFTGRLAEALHHLPGRRAAPLWLELLPRLLYPLFLLTVLLGNLAFLITFVIPKYERIFADLKLKLPSATSGLIDWCRWLIGQEWMIAVVWWNLVILVNVVVFSSHVKWYLPLVGRLYRMHVRGQFLHTLGLMLETDKPLAQVLDCVIDSRLMPRVVSRRADRLLADLDKGEPLVESLARRGLVTQRMTGLLLAAGKANHLPWALQELGEALTRRSRRIAYRLSMVLFPLLIFGCAVLIALAAAAMFLPMIGLIEGVHG